MRINEIITSGKNALIFYQIPVLSTNSSWKCMEIILNFCLRGRVLQLKGLISNSYIDSQACKRQIVRKKLSVS